MGERPWTATGPRQSVKYGDPQGGQHPGLEKYWPSGFIALVSCLGGCGMDSDPAMPSGGLEWGDGGEVGDVEFSGSGTLWREAASCAVLCTSPGACNYGKRCCLILPDKSNIISLKY